MASTSTLPMYPIICRNDLSVRREWFNFLPSQLEQLSIQERQSVNLYKKVRCLLNKTSTGNLENCVVHFQALPVDNIERLQGVATLIHEKAVDEQMYSHLYAQMCDMLSNIQFPGVPSTVKYPENITFKELVVNCSQNEFENKLKLRFDKEEALKVCEDVADIEEREKLKLFFEEEALISRAKAVGNAKFVGELFNVKLLSTGIIHRCVRYLLKKGDEESLECLCKLLATIGKGFELKQISDGLDPQYFLIQYFTDIQSAVKKLGDDGLSPRVRFMVQDLTDLARNKWVPRRQWDEIDLQDYDLIDSNKVPKRKTKDIPLRLHV